MKISIKISFLLFLLLPLFFLNINTIAHAYSKNPLCKNLDLLIQKQQNTIVYLSVHCAHCHDFVSKLLTKNQKTKNPILLVFKEHDKVEIFRYLAKASWREELKNNICFSPFSWKKKLKSHHTPQLLSLNSFIF